MAGGTGRLASAALLLLVLSPLPGRATDEPASPPPSRPPADHGGVDRLDLRVPPSVVKTPPLVRASGTASRGRALRLEPRKSLIEQGIEGSREALIACQKGDYPGATVSASATKVAGGEAQPDHCYRF